MINKKEDYEELEQYDYSDGEYIEKVLSKYSPLIGLFLINFSALEQDLNLAIADFVHDDSNELGFVIIEKLSMSNKIELFYKMYIRLESFKKKGNIKILANIRLQFENLNLFRNSLVHANWQSLTKDGSVRTKIVVDNQEGYVKFRKVSITTRVIRQKLKEIDKLIEQLDKYTETAFQF